LRGQTFEHALDIGGQSQLEQIGQAALFRFVHDRLVAKPAVATQQSRPEIARDAIEQRPQAWREMFGCVLIAGDNINVEDQSCASH